MKKILISICLLTISVSYSTIRNVPGTYSTIQSAINASVNGDTVLVQPGTYLENINFRGKKIVLTSNYYLTNDPSIINSTIINGSNPPNPDTGTCVMFNNNEDSTTVLQGFTITGGTGTKWLDPHGAGVYREGGGILIHFCSPIIQNNIIKGNFATNTTGVSGAGGGGIRIGDGNPKIINNAIIFNSGLYGAGVVLNYVGCIIKNNIICSNYGANSFGAGGGIWVNGTLTGYQKLIENNTICNNVAAAGTGGIYVYSSSFIGHNNIIWGNVSTTGGQVSGSAAMTYSDVQGGYAGTGNINLNPQFSDSNYILSFTSPCIDAGDSSAIYNDPQDSLNPGHAKYPSMGTTRNDMGAYGGPLRKILSSIPIGIKPINNIVPEKFFLYQNYPNPFNPSTTIRFLIPVNNSPLYKSEAGVFVSLKIYNILGYEVATLVNEKLQPGIYKVVWNAINYSSGIYFYKLTAGNFTLSRKMILVK